MAVEKTGKVRNGVFVGQYPEVPIKKNPERRAKTLSEQIRKMSDMEKDGKPLNSCCLRECLVNVENFLGDSDIRPYLTISGEGSIRDLCSLVIKLDDDLGNIERANRILEKITRN